MRGAIPAGQRASGGVINPRPGRAPGLLVCSVSHNCPVIDTGFTIISVEKESRFRIRPPTLQRGFFVWQLLKRGVSPVASSGENLVSDKAVLNYGGKRLKKLPETGGQYGCSRKKCQKSYEEGGVIYCNAHSC